MDDPQLFAPCGVHCGVCPYLMAYKDKNDLLKEKLAKSISIQPKQIVCDGCNTKTGVTLFFCAECKIKKCVQKKGIDSCAACAEYPCKGIDNYPYKPFLQILKWNVNYQKKYGKTQWIAKTIELNTCPTCQTLNHWRARRCKSCKNDLEERYEI